MVKRLVLHFWEVLCSVWRPAVLIEVFNGFTQSLKANSWVSTLNYVITAFFQVLYSSYLIDRLIICCYMPLKV